jgi:hypothetical protein
MNLTLGSNPPTRLGILDLRVETWRSRPDDVSFAFSDHPNDPMTDTTPTTRRTPRPRGEGQWGLGYHEPLNTAEQIKKESEPLLVRERIERVAPGGFRSIGKQDLRSRMRWWASHPAQAERPRRAHGLGRTGGARGRVLHDAIRTTAGA